MARKVRVVLAGCGGICGAWLNSDAARKRVEVVGLVDVRSEAAEKRQKDFNLPGAMLGADLAKVLSKTRPEAVFDCTTPESHSEVTLTALKHGCHVLGEKPLSDTVANARRMVAAAKRADRIYAVTQNYRYRAPIRSLRAFLDSGRIGPVTTVQSNFFIGAHFGGFRDRMEHVLLLDMAIHSFDAARFITGADPRTVYCHEWNPQGSWFDGAASAVAIFEMTGGIVYTYQGSWCADGSNTGWDSQWRIIGEKGFVLWDGAEGFTAEVVKSDKGFIRATRPLKLPVRPLKRQSHDAIISEFLDCIEKGGTPETVCTDNIKSLAMVHGAVESATKARKVKITV